MAYVSREINKKGRHLGLNRWYLIVFPLFAVALGTLYHYSEGSVLAGFSVELPLVEISSKLESTERFTSTNWVSIIYWTGLIFSVLHFVWSLWKARQPRGAELLNRLGQQRIYLVSNTRHSYSHFNDIYLSEYDLQNVDFILEHELAHARQHHSRDLILIRIVRALFWFHPIVYLWESKMKENHEFLADHACVKNTQDIKQYSYALLASHMGVSIPDLAYGFNRKSLLQKRIIQLKTQNTFNMKKVILIPAVIAGVVLTMSVQLKTVENVTRTPSHEKTENVLGEGETKPEFVGGMSAMITYLQENIEYPKELANKNIEAKVYVKFVVASSGNIKKVTVARGSEHDAFNKEAVRVISNMPDWKPGMKDGKKVSTEMTLPIQFVLTK